MKKWVVYLLGIVTGVVLTFAALFGISIIKDAIDNRSKPTPEPVVTVDENPVDNRYTMFDEPGEVLEDRAVQVFQVVSQDAALVKGQDARTRRLGSDLFLGPIYMYMNNEGKILYDEQIIKAPAGKVFRQMGIFRYEANSGMLKTVPVITLMDK